MGKNKKIVFIIGNGFDLDLGRDTSYKSFYNSPHCPKDYPAPIIKHLNDKWPDGGEGVKWYDLENEFLHYYDSIAKKDGPKDVLTKIEQEYILFNKSVSSNNNNIYRFRSYLNKKGYYNYNELITRVFRYSEDLLLSDAERDKTAVSIIKSSLCDYLRGIVKKNILSENSHAFKILSVLTGSLPENYILDIYNFNFTELPQTDTSDDHKDLIHEHYVHGRATDNNIIIGTKDYRELNLNYEFLQKSFDSNFAPPPIVYDLLSADDVVIFGHSLGANDSQYFKAFFRKQSSPDNSDRKTITIFTLDDKSETEIKHSLQQMTDYNLSSLASLNDFKIIKTSRISHDSESFKIFLSRYINDKRDSHLET